MKRTIIISILSTIAVLYWHSRLQTVERDLKTQKAYMEEVWATFNKQSADIQRIFESEMADTDLWVAHLAMHKRMQQEEADRQAERFYHYGRIIELTNANSIINLTNVWATNVFRGYWVTNDGYWVTNEWPNR